MKKLHPFRLHYRTFGKKPEHSEVDMKKRHKIFYKLLQPLVRIYLKLKFAYRYKKPTDLPQNYIVLSNHATDYDPIFLGVAFPRQMYFVASEHITRFGRLYGLLNYVFAPIVRYKGTIAASTVIDIMRKTKRGGNVCIFAEGARTWDGVTSKIHPSTAKLVKAAGCGLVTFKLSGGYFASPMWSGSKNTRKGRVYGECVHTFTREEVEKMSDDELLKIIESDLYENAYERQKAAPVRYKGRNLAIGLERLIFKCPVCSAYDSITSHANSASCSECKTVISYNEYGMLSGLPFDTLLELSDWQKDEVIKDAEKGAVYSSEAAQLFRIENHEPSLVDEGELSLSCSELTCGKTSFDTGKIPDLSMHGNNCLVFIADGAYYEIKLPVGLNAYKYMLFFSALKKNTSEVN